MQLLREACPLDRPYDVDNIYRILQNHNVDITHFKNGVLKYIFDDVSNAKQRLCIIGPSNTGLSEILNTETFISENTVYKFKPLLNAELIVIPELQKLLDSRVLKETALLALLSESSSLNIPVSSDGTQHKLKQDLPIFIMNQSSRFLSFSDLPSLNNRLSIVRFSGPPFSSNLQIPISGKALAYFLLRDQQ
ncbi:hypothetical protein O9G_004990 [Rozella allomycis CSF55]|uniref:Uncharacterized protein n=1 Tax=Rozella allomycis (strain CSF55) TaxID=988480 RepID=A0A075AUW9_ROZAC|nr:hypothetical protein O9G_004990 [Rozella allomycis CSF55]|eukprot:EPZ34053.1 hypothetical protein O9G_004990 [Rozella allomycis CSF55]